MKLLCSLAALVPLFSTALGDEAPWPRSVTAPPFELKSSTAPNAEKRFAYEAPHFAIESDVALPTGVVRDLALVFEATRAVLAALPLALGVDDSSRRFRVLLLNTPETYAAEGGPAGSGGYFNGREMLILLPNLGISAKDGRIDARHQNNLFVVKHEVTHQILRRGSSRWPVWLNEGFAECVASWPYTQGRYTFDSLDSAMRRYLLKWQGSNSRDPLPIISPSTLMRLTPSDWDTQIAAENAYRHYNSSALLTHYFLFHDHEGKRSALAVYLEALRAGMSPAEAEAAHLWRGRSPAQLNAALAALARRMALPIKFGD
ncbi:MAG: hypothetical protein ABI680_17240 [Chthoniobacteraceae bacterium]